MARKSKKLPTMIPQTLAEVEQLEREITQDLLEIGSLEDDANTKIAAINAASALRIGPLLEAVIERAQRVFAYAEANKDALTEGGKRKSANLGHAGTVQWAISPPAVSLRDTEEVLAHLKRLGFERFIRRGPDEVNKEALLREPDTAKTVPGVSIGQNKKFYLRPADAPARVERSFESRKWKVVWLK